MKSAALAILTAGLAFCQQTEIQDGLFVRVTSDTSAIAGHPPLRYPKQAMAELLQGTVVAKAAVDAAGRVGEVVIVSGPSALHAAAMEAVKQFRFVPGAVERQVSLEYRIPAQNISALENAQTAIAGLQGRLPKAPRKPLAGRTVKGIQFLGVGVDAQEAVYEQMDIKNGDLLTNEGMDRAEESLRKLDPKIQFKVLSVGDSDAIVILFRETAKH